MVKVTGAFRKSSEIMKVTNQLVKLPQLSATMREMSMEMMKVGSTLASGSRFNQVNMLIDPVGDHGGDDGRDIRFGG